MISSHTRSSDGTLPHRGRPRSSDNEDHQDWENHLMIRFPPDIAPRVKEMVENESHANDRLRISMNEDLRTGTVVFDEQKLPFTLYDLPTITEVMKTPDNVTMYKVADLCQMIVCSSPQTQDQVEKNRQAPETVDESKDPEAKYQWPDGICPPMKNAREWRFRKVKRKKYMDIPEVEKELKRLLRADMAAISVQWEVVEGGEDDEAMATTEAPQKKGDQQQKSPAGGIATAAPSMEQSKEAVPPTAPESSSQQAIAELFAELSSDDDDEENEEEQRPSARDAPEQNNPATTVAVSHHDYLMDDLHLSSDDDDDDDNEEDEDEPLDEDNGGEKMQTTIGDEDQDAAAGGMLEHDENSQL